MSLWGNTDEASSKPKFVPAADQDRLYFVDRTEAGTPEARAKGMSTAGWYLYDTYTDIGGNVRHKSELLVALSRAAADALDGTDDTILPDFRIVVSTQPVGASVIAGATASFTVVAVSDPVGQALTYQWQKAESGTPTVFADVALATAATYTTAATVLATDNGDVYRCVISAPNVKNVITNEVVLTVTA